MLAYIIGSGLNQPPNKGICRTSHCALKD